MPRGLLLALETATRATSVALLGEAEEPLAEIEDEAGRPHSERLLPAVEAVLARAGVAVGDVAGYAVSLGPGSFTGLRIGVATVQGFALVDARPLVGVPTLAALAAAAAGPGPRAALLDARRGEVYAAAYSDPWTGAPDVLAEGLYRPVAVARALPRGATLVLAPSAAWAGEEVARERPDLVLVEAACRARRVGALARGLPAASGPLLPRYVRRAEAEVKRTGQATEPAESAGAGPTV